MNRFEALDYAIARLRSERRRVKDVIAPDDKARRIQRNRLSYLNDMLAELMLLQAEVRAGLVRD